jgi:hypothetical protein
MNTTAETLKRMAAELRTLFPESGIVELSASESGQIYVTLHQCGNYQEASAILSRHGFGERNKQIVGDNKDAWCNVFADDGKFSIRAFANGLPPSCKIVREKVQIPKRETVDTGEFIEIEQERVVCGEEA